MQVKIKRTYYKVPTSHALVQDAVKKYEEQEANINSIQDKIKELTKCQTVCYQIVFGRYVFNSIAFQKELSAEDCKNTGVRFYMGNEGFSLYTPNKRYKKGKEIESLLESISNTNTFSCLLTNMFGVSNELFLARKIHRSVAVQSKNKDFILFNLVNVKDVPDEFIKIKESEYLALQGK